MTTKAIILHGGAWSIPENHVSPSIDGIRAAALCGYKVLEIGGSAVEAVEAAVACMEDNKYFNAGVGSCLNLDGEIEMDAIIMDGTVLNSGAVAAVKWIKNPVKLARLVMEKTDHTLLVGHGANRAARQLGVTEVNHEDLVADHAKEEFEVFTKFSETRDVLYRGAHEVRQNHDTVGACALDGDGHVACAVSTGGLTAKMPGRVGDTPLIGCGGYADDQSGAVACTGHGESIAKTCLAYRICNLMEQGLTAQAATEEGVVYMKSRLNRYGGAITVDRFGNFGRCFTTERMPWATINSHDKVVHYGINPGDDFCENLPSRDRVLH